MSRLQLKLLCLIGLLWSIFGIISSLYVIYDFWFLTIDLTLKNKYNLLGASITTFLLVTIIILLSIAISNFLEEIKK